MKYKITELQDQLQDYEEEHENLLSQIKELQAHSDLNQRAEVESKYTPEKVLKKPLSNETMKLNDRVEASDTKSKVDLKDLNEPPEKTPEQQIYELKKRLKKDEENRKKWQEVVKKKEDIIKDLKKSIEALEEKVKEEQSLKKGISNSVSQKDNKITVLTNKVKELQDANKQLQKKNKEFESKIEEIENSDKVSKKSSKKAAQKKEPSDAPKLFGADEDALMDVLYGAPIPPRKEEQKAQLPRGVDKFGHEEIPPAKHLKKPHNTSAKKEEGKHVRFGENLNMHENSSTSSLGDEEVQPVKAQPFLFGAEDHDMEDMGFPTDKHLHGQINI